MIKYPSKGESVWLHTTETTSLYPTLEADLTIDVAVIGGGIAGLTTAYLLKQQGKRVAVFEKGIIGSGVSGYTTGKISSLHGLTYSNLIKKFDRETAQIYGEANEAAIAGIEEIVEREHIDCDWRREDNYIHTEEEKMVETLRQEAVDAASLGLPASFETELLPNLRAKAGVRFADQATFHVVKYLQGLARAIHGDGSYVFENTKAHLFHDGTPATFRVSHGKVTATDIILATNAPYAPKDHAAYALYEYPMRSYLVAGRVTEDIPGMYISVDSPSRSVLPTIINGEKWLLIGGDGHFVGKSGPAAHHYKKLSDYARERFGVTNIEYKWSTWDFVAYDGLPLVGKLYPFTEHLYTATAFRKWGLSNSYVAGKILTDAIMGTENPWAHILHTNRASAVTSLPQGLVKGILS